MANLVLTSTDKDRETVLASMEEKTRVLAIEGGEKLVKIHAAGILLYYELGEMINDIATDETIDGDGEITKLAQYWGITNTTKLYEWRNVALNFDKAFLAEQARELLPNGREITFEHFKALRLVESEKTRAKLLKKVRKESWSANELASEIRASGSVTTKRQGGRNPSIPSSAAAIVKKCHSLSQQLYRYLDAVGSEAADRFEELPADEATPKLSESITEALTMLDLAINQVVAFDATLKTARVRVNTILSGTKAAYQPGTTGSALDELPEFDEIVEDNRADVMEGPQATIEDLRARTVASVSTAAKKRGRPKGSKNKSKAPEDSAVIGKKKKRGRPRGSKNKVKPSTD